MKLSEKDKQLTILIEDVYEWLEMFDNGTPNIIQLSINRINVDFFFPNRRKYINDDDLEQKLIDDANRFDTIKIEVADGIMEKNGEGIFEVNGFDFDIISDPDNEKFALPIEVENGDFAIIAYVVSPELYDA